MPDVSWQQALVTLGAALIAAVGAWLAKKAGAPGERENRLMDQLQEEVEGYRKEAEGYRKEVAGLREDVRQLNERVTLLLSRDAHWSIHVTRQNGVIAGLGGKPLPLPAELAS